MLGQGIMLWGLLRRSLICYGCSLADHKEEERADNKSAEADEQRVGQQPLEVDVAQGQIGQGPEGLDDVGDLVAVSIAAQQLGHGNIQLGGNICGVCGHRVRRGRAEGPYRA